MGFGEAIQSGFKNYVTWRGRATRSEFWWWMLFVYLVQIPFSIIYSISVQNLVNEGTFEIGMFFNWAYYLMLVVSLVLVLPSISVLIRRLHDTDRSGGWYWILLIPVVGTIVLLVFTLSASTPSPNRFES
jgi:uncharacterized membrane protein YhaH (DUF805 family)